MLVWDFAGDIEGTTFLILRGEWNEEQVELDCDRFDFIIPTALLNTPDTVAVFVLKLSSRR